MDGTALLRLSCTDVLEEVGNEDGGYLDSSRGVNGEGGSRPDREDGECMTRSDCGVTVPVDTVRVFA